MYLTFGFSQKEKLALNNLLFKEG